MAVNRSQNFILTHFTYAVGIAGGHNLTDILGFHIAKTKRLKLWNQVVDQAAIQSV
jgi:hypothetical protein